MKLSSIDGLGLKAFGAVLDLSSRFACKVEDAASRRGIVSPASSMGGAAAVLRSAARSPFMQYALILAAAALLWMLTSGSALAAVDDGGEFEDLYNLVRSWSTGYLGKTISVTFLLVGLGIGIIRGSVVAAVSAIAAGVALLMLPNIVDAMFGAGSV